MAPTIETRPFFENPNAIPVKTKARPDLFPSSPPTAMSQGHHDQPRYEQDRSLHQPVQPFRIHEDQNIAEEWQADKQNLYEQLEKLTLKLDTANTMASSQAQRIFDLEKLLKEKEALIKEYQKTLRTDRANKEAARSAMNNILDQCERFKAEIVRLSHRIHRLQGAIINAQDADQLQAQFLKLKHEGDIAKTNQPPRVSKGET